MSKKVRVIARLDVKGPNVIKGVQFECLRVLGKPEILAEKYYLQGADEIIYIDSVASLYRRDPDLDLIRRTARRVLVPITVGGGVRTIADISRMLRAGADKVAINTAAIRNPYLIGQASQVFGAQCIVVSIAAKKIGDQKWEAFTDNTREPSGVDVVEWAKRAEELGAGEILLSSVDQDGTQDGFDLDLINAVAKVVSVPLIVSSGAGKAEDFTALSAYPIDGVAAGTVLHYDKLTVADIKKTLAAKKVTTRNVAPAAKYPAGSKSPGEPTVKNYSLYTVRQFAEINQANNRKKPAEKTPRESSKATIGVVNCGINNIESVVKALRTIGKTATVIEHPRDIETVKALLLPGMGAFADGMDELRSRQLLEPIKQAVKSGKPILGICLGMQLLFTESEEFGRHDGLNLLTGKVVALRPKNQGVKVPNIGWSSFKPRGKKKLFQAIPSGSEVYFAQSYYPVPKSNDMVIATTTYGGQTFCSAVEAGNIVGTLFHPEKSGVVGLTILKNFCQQYKL